MSTDKTPHQFRDLIIAWANGEKIERYDPQIQKWEDIETPMWNAETKYRLKPPPKDYIVRLFLYDPNYDDDFGTHSDEREVVLVTQADNAIDPREDWNGFVKWLGYWQTYSAVE